MTDVNTPPWADTGCLLRGAPPTLGHHDDCAGADPHAVHYLTQKLPDTTTRSWTMAGARLTATNARRAAITALMPTMDWQKAGRRVNLPFTVGALINEIAPKQGVQRSLARFGFHPAATIRIPDCGCTDPLRCDFDGRPHANAHPDRWADYELLVLRLRRPQGCLDLWLPDTGTAAVVIAEDERRNDPVPAEASINSPDGLVRPVRRRPKGRAPNDHAGVHAHLPPGDRCGRRRPTHDGSRR